MIPGWNVEGPKEVVAGSKVKFSIPTVGQKKAYINTWKVPEDCKVVGGQTGTTLELIWGNKSGRVTLEEMSPNGCRYYHSTVEVKLKN